MTCLSPNNVSKKDPFFFFFMSLKWMYWSTCGSCRNALLFKYLGAGVIVLPFCAHLNRHTYTPWHFGPEKLRGILFSVSTHIRITWKWARTPTSHSSLPSSPFLQCSTYNSTYPTVPRSDSSSFISVCVCMNSDCVQACPDSFSLCGWWLESSFSDCPLQCGFSGSWALQGKGDVRK